MPTLATLQTWLDEAYTARHNLRTGALAQSMSHGGRTVQYTAANASELDAYIAELQTQITESTTSATRKRVYRIKQTGQGY
jgi:hypothetical protein